MIRTITVENVQGDSLLLDLKESQEELGIVVFKVDGLGAPSATINTVGSPNIDGTRFNSSKAQQRNIVITLIITAKGDDEETVRQSLYQYFPTKEWIRITVESDTRVSYIDGYVESNPINMFAEHENTEISIICPGTWFIKSTPTNVVFSGTTPLFEFPFSNESLTEPLINFGEELTYVNRVIDYAGDTDAGAIFRLHCTGPVAEDGFIAIYNTSYREEMVIDTSVVEAIVGEPLDLGADIIINTRPGEKSVYYEKSGVRYNILNAKNLYSDWITLRRNTNTIAYGASSGIDNLEMEMSYNELYQGA